MHFSERTGSGAMLPTAARLQVDELERSLRTSTELLQSLLKGLRERRGAWASVRPSTLAPAAELEQLAASLAQQEQRRKELLQSLATHLPAAPGVPAAELHVNVSALAALLPAAAARSLRAAAALATAAARDVRAEVAFGERLLAFTSRAQDDVLRQLGGTPPAAVAAAGYDRHARVRGGPGVVRTGGLVDGRI
jgi:hypothetical protein